MENRLYDTSGPSAEMPVTEEWVVILATLEEVVRKILRVKEQ